MPANDSLSAQLTALADRARALRDRDIYGSAFGAAYGAFTGQSAESELSMVVLEAHVLLDKQSKFQLIVQKLLILAAHPKPQYLEIHGALKIAANMANQPEMPPISLRPRKADYIDKIRIKELQEAAVGTTFDVSRLIRLCEELNSSFREDNLMATAMLLRAIKDHCPPIFGQKNFSSVVAQVPGKKDSSVKNELQRLDQALKDVADKHLHSQISSHEPLPTLAQVSFQSETDALMGEIARALKKARVVQ